MLKRFLNYRCPCGVVTGRGLLAGVVFVLSIALWNGRKTADAVAPGVPPLKVDILDAQQKKQGLALIYSNYVELTDAVGKPQGAIGVVWVQGRAQLFLIRANEERQFIGWSSAQKLYDAKDTLVGYYHWTPIWSYVYNPEMKKVGQAQCLAYQGVCAAGIAGYLLGLF